MGGMYCYKPETPSDRKVFVATPSYSGATAPSFQVSLIRSIEKARQRNIGVEFWLLAGDCHVDDARNNLIRSFLESDCELFFFIDADVGWNAEDFIKLVESDKDVVAGVYPKKTDDINANWPLRLSSGELWTDADGWMEVEAVPTGFLRMKRSVVQKLYDAEDRKHTGRTDKNRLPKAIIFERIYEDGNRIGGDIAGCLKWRRMGGKIFIDPEMRFTHEGTKEWRGCLGHHLRWKNGLLESQIGKVLSQIEADNYEETDLISLYEAWDNTKWSASPEILLSASFMLETCDRENVLELGSGLSTLVFAAIAKRKGFSIQSVEHDKSWYRIVSDYLNKFGYTNVDLVYAPIKDNWYDFCPEREFDFVFCDGPPKTDYPDARNHLSLIQDKFKKNCLLIFDDCNDCSAPDLSEIRYFTYGSAQNLAIGIKQ